MARIIDIHNRINQKLAGAKGILQETRETGLKRRGDKKKTQERNTSKIGLLFTVPEKVPPLSENAAIGQLSAVHAHKTSK